MNLSLDLNGRSMKRLLIVSVAALFLTTGCRSISSNGLPEQYEPAFASDDTETAEPLLGTLKSRVQSTADQINSKIGSAARSASEFPGKAADAIGEQFEPIDD